MKKQKYTITFTCRSGHPDVERVVKTVLGVGALILREVRVVKVKKWKKPVRQKGLPS